MRRVRGPSVTWYFAGGSGVKIASISFARRRSVSDCPLGASVTCDGNVPTILTPAAESAAPTTQEIFAGSCPK
jgi:hypothetical protein